MNYLQLNRFDTMNGSGCRVSLFVSGCEIHCPHCFNRQSWDYKAGEEFSEEVKENLFKYLSHPDIDGISILGGEPFADGNWEEVYKLILEIRERMPEKSILCYSGYTKEQIEQTPKKVILDLIDTLIDGPYIHEKRNPDLMYRGSENQRILEHDRKKQYWLYPEN